MTRVLAVTLSLLLFGTAASAQGIFGPGQAIGPTAQLTPMQRQVDRDLPRYGVRDVDVRDLTPGQVASIYSLMHSNRSAGDVRLLIRSAVGKGLFSGLASRR